MISQYPGITGLVDVGAGNGTVAAHLSSNGLDTIAVEPGLEGALWAARRGVNISFAGHLADLRLPTDSIPAIGLFDVIEHIEDPRELLNEVHRVLQPGGFCFVTVPAYQFLWSQADEHAGHYRRYRRKTLDALLRDCHFEPRFTSYCFTAAVPFLFALRTVPYRLGRRLSEGQLEESLLAELSDQGRLSTFAGQQLNRFEARWIRRAPLPFGTSIIAAYRKEWQTT